MKKGVLMVIPPSPWRINGPDDLEKETKYEAAASAVYTTSLRRHIRGASMTSESAPTPTSGSELTAAPWWHIRPTRTRLCSLTFVTEATFCLSADTDTAKGRLKQACSPERWPGRKWLWWGRALRSRPGSRAAAASPLSPLLAPQSSSSPPCWPESDRLKSKQTRQSVQWLP